MTRLTVIRSVEGSETFRSGIVGRRAPGAGAVAKVTARRNARGEPGKRSQVTVAGIRGGANTNGSVGYGVTSSDAGTLRLTTLSRPSRTDAERSSKRQRGPSKIATAPSAGGGGSPPTDAHSNGSARTLTDGVADGGSAGSLGAQSAPATAADLIRSEGALIERVRAGDVAAFSGLVQRHMRAAFGIAYHVLQHREDAEDAVQQAFMAALARIDSFDITRPFGPWFARVVLNHARSARRARTRVARRQVEPVDTLDPSPSASPERMAQDSEIRERVRAAVATLPDRQRLAVQLIDIDGYGAAEVAAMLELSPVTMRWHLMAARRTLRRLLAPLVEARHVAPVAGVTHNEGRGRRGQPPGVAGGEDADSNTGGPDT